MSDDEIDAMIAHRLWDGTCPRGWLYVLIWRKEQPGYIRPMDRADRN